MANIGKHAATSPQPRHQQEQPVRVSGIQSRTLPGVGHGQGIASARAREADEDLLPSTDQSRERAENAPPDDDERDDGEPEDETA
jgi:hypothetical protein